MSGRTRSPPLVVVGGWGVRASMLGRLVSGWSGSVDFVSLNDGLMAANASVASLAQNLMQHFPDPAVWLGWSQGAQVVMAAATCPGTPVVKAVTLAGFPRFVAGSDWSPGMAPDTFKAFHDALITDSERTWRRFQQLLVYGSSGPESAAVRRELKPWLAAGPVANAENLRKGLDWLAWEDQRQAWQQADLPALHLLAGADALVRPWATDLSMSGAASVKTLPGMTHWPTGLHLAICRQALAEFALAEEMV